jgi:soluble lytic murein transglycosylase-like protein
MRNSKVSEDRTQLVNRSGLWRWQYDGDKSGTPLFGQGTASAIVGQWERESRAPVTRRLHDVAAAGRRHAGKIAALVVTFLLGATLAAGPNSGTAALQLRDRLRRTEAKLKARQGELELVRLEISRLNSIVEHSRQYKIPADLAASIYDIALSEGIDPKIAFGLVNVESEFSRKAVSRVGAVGLTQLMPETAMLLQPGLTYNDLFDRETNLRLGFRFLREMLTYYKGDLDLALTAYNRGPTRVDQIRKQGVDPDNGYADKVTNGTR